MPAKKSPGPADYTLKSLIGLTNHEVNSLYVKRPGWSINSRPKTFSGGFSASAASYQIGNVTRNGKPPGVPYSIGKRPETSKIEPSSGPYNAVNVTTYKSATGPKYTIGIKTKDVTENKRDRSELYDTVPLNVYKRKTPIFTMIGRAKDAPEDQGPGPMKYNTNKDYKKMIAKQSPAYTILKRRDKCNGKEKRPGPADYDLRNYNPFDNSPKHTCRPKHSEYEHILILPQDNC
ncbi:hypothetical protein PVAND_010297 [Polypedilum vanderplanki]|uniref:Outer dense fiber protein 3 n=1 Tax=Polypedilum vanderplanki TaxID=319348 RepID=A0A9J6CFG6_POLVA|nr:hypothetical protein PVAND_010297 [Polypedilum vanderplanki]